MISTLIALPIIGILFGGAVQLGLLYQANSIVNLAAQEAARTAATKNASSESVIRGLATGLNSLYVGGSGDYHDIKRGIDNYIPSDLRRHSCVAILSPSAAAFSDFDVTAADPIQDNKISVWELASLPRTPGAVSGKSIQDAMNLKIKVVYGARADVPIVGPLITKMILQFSSVSGVKRKILENNRIPIEGFGESRMQSDAILNAKMEQRC